MRIESVASDVTSVELMRHVKAASGSSRDIERFLRDFFASIVAAARRARPARAPDARIGHHEMVTVSFLQARSEDELGAFRAKELPRGYSLGRHLLGTAAMTLGFLGLAAWLARGASALDWMLFPVFLPIANFIEWTFHRYPMHRPLGPRIIYRNHTLSHHRAFPHQTMEVKEPRELGLVMMPWYTIVILFVIAIPVLLLAGLLRGPGLAGVFLVAAVVYFVLYEALHAAYHLPERSILRLGGLGRALHRLLVHHRHHHRFDRMSQVNFNVTFPLADWLLGTFERPGP